MHLETKIYKREVIILYMHQHVYYVVAYNTCTQKLV
jgi:hypothetical protein